MGRPSPAVCDLVATLWPGADLDEATVRHVASGVVVVVPGVMAVRIARTGEGELRRSASLLSVLAGAGLPFAVPEPLSPVMYHAGMTALATTLVPGRARPVLDPPPADP